jgi:hypothetical protein
MIFTTGIGLICAGWWLAWFFGDWHNMERNWCDKIGGALFGIGLGLSLSSMIIAAIKYMP